MKPNNHLLTEISSYLAKNNQLLFHILPRVLFLISLISFSLVLLILLLKFYLLKKQTKEKRTFLEITPPSTADQSAFSTEQLFTTLHSLGKQILLFQSLGNQKRYSLELISTKSEGIRFLLTTNFNDADIIQRNIEAYLPGVSVQKIADYLPGLNQTLNQNSKIAELRLKNSFLFPLQNQNKLSTHDPIAWISRYRRLAKDFERFGRT